MHIDDNPYEGSTGSASGQTGALNNDGPAPGVQSYGIEDNPYEGSRSFGGGGMSSGNDAGSEPAPGAQSEGVNSYSDGAGNENNSQDISTNSTSDQDQEDQESGGGDDDPDTGEMPNPEDSHGGGNPWSRQVNRGQIKNVREYTPADTSLKLNARIKGYTPPDLGRVQKAEPSARQ